MSDRYRKGAHTVHDIKYHFVWKTKYSYGVLNGTIALRLRQIITEVPQRKFQIFFKTH